MRTPNYMSPTSLKLFESDKDAFYMRYLADNRPPREPQTTAMAAGSAFDAYCKSFIHYRLFGNYGPDNRYEPDAIFEAQVEPHVRDWARVNGRRLFDLYKKSGALSDLMLELNTSVNAPRFEFDIQDTIQGNTGSVPLLGKPDIFFINDQGCRILLDWKVNGYCNHNKMTSPEQGYVMCRDSWLPSERKSSPRNRLPHKDCSPTMFRGIKINSRIMMEKVNNDWANQTTTYAWLLGEEIGSDGLVVGIEQLCGVPHNHPDTQLVRVASHRCRVSNDFQINLHQRYVHAWELIKSGNIFPELGQATGLEHQADLDRMADALANAAPDSFEAASYRMAKR